jgi:hypothetical protein
LTLQQSGAWSAIGIAIEAEACGTPVLTVITQWLRLEWQAHRRKNSHTRHPGNAW